VVFQTADPADVFGPLQPGEELRAITSAPESEIRRFHKKSFDYDGAHYEILCDLCGNPHQSPYSRRFLSIRYQSTGVSHEYGETTAIISSPPESPNLWLRPQMVSLTGEQVRHDFGATNVLGQLKGSFILPPCRAVKKAAEPDKPYFDPSLLEIRARLLEKAATSDPRQEAAILTMMRLCDELLLRDILQDGGSLELTGKEGGPTSFNLRVWDRESPGAEYRAHTIVHSESIGGPPWASELARAVQQDIVNIHPPVVLSLAKALQPKAWASGAPLRDAVDGLHEPGTWKVLSDLKDNLQLSTDDRKLFWELILLKGAATVSMQYPDHDLAEQLMMHYLWRCPWDREKAEERSVDAWLEAFREILGHELGRSPDFTPEDRIAEWNTAEGAANFKPSRLGESGASYEGAFVLKHSGDPNADEVVQWRLVLPWGSIVNARTLILNRPGRSRLDKTFVLA